MHNQRKKALRDLLQTYCIGSYRQQSLPKSILIVYMQAQNSPRCTNALSIDSVFRFPTSESQKFNPPANKQKKHIPSMLYCCPLSRNLEQDGCSENQFYHFKLYSLIHSSKRHNNNKSLNGVIAIKVSRCNCLMQYLVFFQLWSFMPKGLNCTIILSMYWNNTTYTPTPLLESLT